MPTIEMKTELPGPKSRAIIERKERVVCDPLHLHVNAVIDHGFGAAVIDVDGNTMLEFSSGLGCLMVGQSHPKVVEAVQRQAARFSHTDFSVVRTRSTWTSPSGWSSVSGRAGRWRCSTGGRRPWRTPSSSPRRRRGDPR